MIANCGHEDGLSGPSDEDVLVSSVDESAPIRDPQQAHLKRAYLMTKVYCARQYGYTQTLHRGWKQFESFSAAFGSLYFVGGIRILFSIGIKSGAVLAEVCSAVPLSGSIYIWAADAGGPKYGRLFGFVTAFWSTTAWTSFVACNTQATTNFLISELNAFHATFDGPLDYSNFEYRLVAWLCAQVFLALAILTNLMPPRVFTWIFRGSFAIIMIDFVMTMTWLPIGVARTYGFQPASFLLTYYNGTGAPDIWNIMLVFLSTSGVMTGFDAAGHIAEETQGASLRTARGLFWGCAATGILAFPVLMLFLLCSPSLDVLFALDAPQPFVNLYALALGNAGQIVMTAVAIFGLFMNTSLAIVAASRLIYAIARDGVLPGSIWISRISEHGQPRNAVLFIWIVSAALICTILPSQVAFTSLVSAAGLPLITSYALVAGARVFCTPHKYREAKWNNGPFSLPFCWIALIWSLFLTAVLLSPYQFPVTAQTFNFGPPIWAAVTMMGIVSYFYVPESVWLSKRHFAVEHSSTGAAEAQARKKIRA
ncbi:uncharacterized protein L969DRAFT_50109 [Mixia osmundae IAM 14324]|uniref:Amino acid permease/ SLC12A domain-containing protein n=1 Tax=Mixia osmundae (strain CBS 9802 / IAM 14324 / JCM 22182 / KY 12970) TaxID=764103 RepID=G7E6S4_MIXOS|nr:uncharacterized protein L969DRAFT_50109 [Mixia osmundae IAM 14324]KEI39083.1 hypothetical protein L969DRAFT_50109 [Mixia osmundae IAM 14324]GAA98534.1 hypothetical protein E5Q_05221 [Mixia osmundae IAM 14324]